MATTGWSARPASRTAWRHGLHGTFPFLIVLPDIGADSGLCPDVGFGHDGLEDALVDAAKFLVAVVDFGLDSIEFGDRAPAGVACAGPPRRS